MIRLRTLALSLAIAAPLVAQDERAALRVQTTDPDVAAAVCKRWAPDSALPELKRGAHWDLRLDAELRLTVDTGTGLVTQTQIVADPRVMAPHLGAEIGAARAVVAATAVPALQRCGVGAAEAEDAMAALFGQIDALDTVRINVTGMLAGPIEDLGVQVWLKPKPDTALAKLIEHVLPYPLPVPLFGGIDSAVLLRASFFLSDAEEALAGVSEWLARIGCRTDEERAAARDRMPDYWRNWRGQLALSWTRDGQMRFLQRLSDHSLLGELYAHPTFAKEVAARSRSGDGTSVEFVPKAFEHEGVALVKTTVTAGDDAGPPFRDGAFTSYSGVAGRYLIAAAGLDDAQMGDLVQKAAADRYSGTKLGDTILATLTVQLAEFAAAMTGGAAAGLPERMSVSFGNGGASLFVKVRFQ